MTLSASAPAGRTAAPPSAAAAPSEPLGCVDDTDTPAAPMLLGKVPASCAVLQASLVRRLSNTTAWMAIN
jgi:hypothetical protein